MQNAEGIFNKESKSYRKALDTSHHYAGADLVEFRGATNHFFILCHPGMADKWRESNGAIPLIEVVERFQVYKGKRAQPDNPSTGELMSDFNTSVPEEIIKIILRNGDIERGSSHGNLRNEHKKPLSTKH